MVNAFRKAENKKVRWACRRGMLELDLFLLPFFDNNYLKLNPREQASFKLLLTATDPELLAWLMGYAIPDNKDVKEIVDKVRNTKHQRQY